MHIALEMNASEQQKAAGMHMHVTMAPGDLIASNADLGRWGNMHHCGLHVCCVTECIERN
jgi:hypothetical protein